jgi:peptidoglycan/LPS O-acetylase OafA/YrhL
MSEFLQLAAVYPIAAVSSLVFYLLMIAAYVPALRDKIRPEFSHPISPKQAHLGSMDALRGFAAAYVAVAHCWHWTYPVFMKSQHVVKPLAFGAKAVPMFALLSGFLIYRSVRNVQSSDDVRYYIARRIFRIYPLYLLSVLLCLWFGQIVSDIKGVSGLAYLVAEVMMFRSMGFLQFANPVTWSLYVEVIFYVFLPVYVMFVGRRHILWVTVVLLILLAIADQVPGREFQLWKYFMFGIAASELSLRYQDVLRSWIGSVILAIGVFLLIVDLGGPRFDWPVHIGLVRENLSAYTIGLGLSFAMIAAAIPHKEAVGRILDTFPLRFIGVVSYSVFIVHPFYLMVNFPELVLHKVGQQTAYFQTLEAMPAWYLFFVFAPGIFAWAAATFVLIERPALIWGSRWIATHKQASNTTEPLQPLHPAGTIFDSLSGWVADNWRTGASKVLPIAAVTIATVLLASGLRASYGIPLPIVATSRATTGQPAPKTRCEVELGPKLCPGMPTFEPARTQQIFADNWDGSGVNLQRCLRRASEFYRACGAGETVRARFYVNGKVVESRSEP